MLSATVSELTVEDDSPQSWSSERPPITFINKARRQSPAKLLFISISRIVSTQISNLPIRAAAAAYYKVQDAAAVDRFPIGSQVARIPRVDVTRVSKGGVPRLVAVKFQVDGCPLAARIEPVFAELVESYAEKPVMFARYDMTNAKSRCFSKNMATGLGFNWACEGAFQSGTILLIDRERREVLAKLTDGLGLPEMVRTLNRALD